MPIGYSGSGNAAKICIANWSRKVKLLLMECRIEIILVLLYVDDIRYFSLGIKLGYYWDLRQKYYERL